MGYIQPAGVASVLSIWRHGEPNVHLPDTDDCEWRSAECGRGRPRVVTQLERQSCQRGELGALLVGEISAERLYAHRLNIIARLNEGWTVYLERRLQAAAHGAPYRDFSAIIGWRALENAVTEFGAEHNFTQLVVDLKGKDPDDAFSSIPYEKGYTFLSALEKLLGQDKWDKFIPHVSPWPAFLRLDTATNSIRQYFTEFKYKSLDSYDFKATLLAFFASDATASEQLTKLDWDAWFYKPGLPPKPTFDTSLADACYALADKWQTLTTDANTTSSTDVFTPHPDDIANWVANQLVIFLERVQTFALHLPASAVRKMDAAYSLSGRGNAEVAFRFYVLGMLARDEAVLAPTVDLLGRVGRMKMVRPLYRHLVVCDRRLALETFERNREFYHPICRDMVRKDLYSGGGGE